MAYKLLAVALAATGAFATTCNATGVFRSPVAKPFVTIDWHTGFAFNTSTPWGDVAQVPIAGGEIKGQFSGFVVENVTSSTEMTIPNDSGVFTTYEAPIVFENADGGRIWAVVSGTTTYQNSNLHGFGKATMRTNVAEFYWVNTAMFVAEWQADYNTGEADIDIFEINTGGRVDGLPIPALEPPAA